MTVKNSTWCGECLRHYAVCICNPKQHIYLVEYKLTIGEGEYPSWCQEKVRCVAYDIYLAMSIVSNWLMTAKYIWWNEDGVITDYKVPEGPRDVTIMKVEIHTEDVGDLLKQMPLPEVFPEE